MQRLITPRLVQLLYTDFFFHDKLKHPPVQSLRHKEDPLMHPTPSLQSIFSVIKPEIHDLHPEPKHIYRLWQIYVETVNPLMKVVHVPTLQQRVLEASWNPRNVSKPLTAILFAIYTLAVTSISSKDCQDSFGETRGDLLTRYRTATLRALVAADILTTNDFEVLQALVLFLFADPESELTTTLAGAAIRLGQKMGLHRDNNHLKISFFEKELRVRLWWQLHGLDSRNRFVGTPGAKPPRPPHSEFGAVRLPLNINDADLHPDMSEPPVEQTGPTEMMCVLMKFELFNWLRSSPTVAKVFDNIHQGPDKANVSMQLKDEAIAELEGMYHDKYFRNLDTSIPLHSLTDVMGHLMLARTRFKAHHPRGRATASNFQGYMTQGEADMLFESALKSVEMMDLGTRSSFSSHLFTHMTSSCKLQIDPYIYVISELRQRCSGERVNLAWKLVEALYNDHPELIQDVENTFFIALGRLSLEAWEARRKQLVNDWVFHSSPPQFIQLLQNKRQSGSEETVQIPMLPDSLGTDGAGLNCESNLSWDYWNDFLTL